METHYRLTQTSAAANGFLVTLRRHPLFFFFLIVFGVPWILEEVFFIYLARPYTIWLNLPILFLGPTAAAFIMTGLAEGWPGFHRLLRSYIRWRVGIRWYLFALLGIPVIELLGAIVMPGTLGFY